MRRNLRFVVVVSFLCAAGCYAHAPMPTPRQLDGGEVALSGQARVPGIAIIPGLAFVGQIGLAGLADLGLQAGTGGGHHYGGLLARAYVGDHVTVMVDGTYVWVPDSYSDRDYQITPDFDDSAALGLEVDFGADVGDSRLYIGPRSQALFYIPDPARADYDNLAPELYDEQLAGVGIGFSTGVSFPISDVFDFQAGVQAMPVIIDTVPEVDLGGTVNENRWQLVFGVTTFL